MCLSSSWYSSYLQVCRVFYFPTSLLSAFLHQRATPLPSIFYCVSCSYEWKAALTKGIRICPATSAAYYWAHCFLPALWSQISFYTTVYSRNSTPSGQQTFSNAFLFSPFAAVTGSATQSCCRQLEFTPPQGSALPHLQGDHKASAAVLNRH